VLSWKRVPACVRLGVVDSDPTGKLTTAVRVEGWLLAGWDAVAGACFRFECA